MTKIVVLDDEGYHFRKGSYTAWEVHAFTQTRYMNSHHKTHFGLKLCPKELRTGWKRKESSAKFVCDSKHEGLSLISCWLFLSIAI
jgi:hypothetical protein